MKTHQKKPESSSYSRSGFHRDFRSQVRISSRQVISRNLNWHLHTCTSNAVFLGKDLYYRSVLGNIGTSYLILTISYLPYVLYNTVYMYRVEFIWAVPMLRMLIIFSRKCVCFNIKTRVIHVSCCNVDYDKMFRCLIYFSKIAFQLLYLQALTRDMDIKPMLSYCSEYKGLNKTDWYFHQTAAVKIAFRNKHFN